MDNNNENQLQQAVGNIRPVQLMLWFLCSIGISEATQILAVMKLNDEISSWAIVFIPMWWNRSCQLLLGLNTLRNAPTIPPAAPNQEVTPAMQHAVNVRTQAWTNIIKTVQLIVLLALIVKKSEDPDFISSFGLLFLPVWLGTFVIAYIEYSYQTELENRCPSIKPKPMEKAVKSVTGNYEFWQVLLICYKVTDQSNLSWEATFLPIWFTVACMYMLVLMGSCGLFFMALADDEGSQEIRRIARLFGFLLLGSMVSVALTLTFLLVRLSSFLEGEDKYSNLEVFFPSIVGSCLFDLFIIIGLLLACLYKNHMMAMVTNLASGNDLTTDATTTEDMLSRPAPSQLQKVSSTYFKRILSQNEILVPQDIVNQEDVALDLESGQYSKEMTSAFSKDTTKCYICYEKEHNAVFMPCGHGGTCYECGINTWKGVKDHACPQCRTTIETVVKIGQPHMENGILVVDVEKDDSSKV